MIKVKKFSAEWCAPCKTMKPRFDNVKQMDEFKDVEFYEYDIEEDEGIDLVTKYGIRNVPTIIITNENDELITRVVGSVDENTLVQTIRDNIK